jgi:hypothetical protein
MDMDEAMNDDNFVKASWHLSNKSWMKRGCVKDLTDKI